MIFHAKATHLARPPKAEVIKKWRWDREQTSAKIGTTAQSASTTFLRRHRLDSHRMIYIDRDIDARINELVSPLRPSRLAIDRKSAKHGAIEFTHQRSRPKQLAIIKDLSGSGKTTLAVQIALQRDRYYGICRAALEPDIDKIGEYLSAIGPDFALQELSIVDKPVVYVTDSLDEAVTLPHKKREVRALIESLKDLNEVASRFDLIGFPILIIFTIRDDFWREWESLFEGREAATFTRRFSYFTPFETERAIKTYSAAYEYEIAGDIGETASKVLSHPFTQLPQFGVNRSLEAAETLGIRPGTPRCGAKSARRLQ